MRRASQTTSRWSTAALAAAAASFHPSKAAMATGSRRTGRPSNSVTGPAYGHNCAVSVPLRRVVPACRRRLPRPVAAGRVGARITARRRAATTNLGAMPTSLQETMRARVLIADGAMGTMLQRANPTLDDFDGYEGCNEILNVTRPDLVREVHDAYLAAGADCVETNTFGANLGNLGDYGIADRIRELSLAGARLAREAADRWSTPDRPRFVLGSMGPGTKLPTLGHASFTALRDAYRENAEGLLAGG